MNHDRRRRTPRPVARQSWVRRATTGWGKALAVVVIFAACLFGAAASDSQTRGLAQQLADQGQWQTSTNVQVHVVQRTSKGGNYWEVDEVRATLPGSTYPVTLQGAQFGDLPDNFPEGWQAPSQQTGFTIPLRVRVLYDGDGTVITAMAEKDLDFWTRGNHHPEWEGLGGIACLALAALIMALNARRRDTSGHYKPDTRARRRAKAWADRVYYAGKRKPAPKPPSSAVAPGGDGRSGPHRQPPAQP